MGNNGSNKKNLTANVERNKRSATTMVPKSLFAAAAATTLTLLSLGLFYLYSSSPPSPLSSSVGFFETFTDDRRVANFSLYLRSKDNHGSGSDISFVSTESSTGNFEFDSNDAAATATEHNNAVPNNPTNREERRRLASEEADTQQYDDFVAKTKNDHFPLFEASDTISVIGPSVFPKPTYVYETEDDNSNNNKIEDEIVTYLQPTSGKHRPDQDSVFVFAAEYGFDTYMLFFMTLYETGFNGDVVVGISRMDWENESIRGMLEYWKNENGEKNEMTVVVYVVPYHCYNLEGEVQSSHKGGMRVCQCHNMFGRKNKDTGDVTPFLDRRHGRTAQTIRYELYWIWSEHYNPTSWILLIDARDTIFQESPFERVPRRATTATTDGGMLIFFGENADATSLGKSKYNRRWITLAYGQRVADAFSTKPTLCSGSTMGEQSAIDAYLRAEVAESDESKTVIFGADQGFHNYLYYSNKLSNAEAISKILVQDQGLGIVNNMGALRDKKLSEWGNGKIVEKTELAVTIHNWDGTVSPVVHQYDRHKELSEWWHKKQIGHFQKQWKKMQQK
jgi:hypothetical protein